jgi:hypothetical protein
MPEHIHKYCSHAVGKDEGAVFLGFGFVLAQSQAAAGMLPHSASPRTPKILAPHGYSISSNAPDLRFREFFKFPVTSQSFLASPHVR